MYVLRGHRHRHRPDAAPARASVPDAAFLRRRCGELAPFPFLAFALHKLPVTFFAPASDLCALRHHQDPAVAALPDWRGRVQRLRASQEHPAKVCTQVLCIYTCVPHCTLCTEVLPLSAAWGACQEGEECAAVQWRWCDVERCCSSFIVSLCLTRLIVVCSWSSPKQNIACVAPPAPQALPSRSIDPPRSPLCPRPERYRPRPNTSAAGPQPQVRTRQFIHQT